MAIRNQVSVEFVVSGPGLAQLDQISARLRNLGTSSGGITQTVGALTRLGQASSTGATGVAKITSAMGGLGSASTKAGGALQRIGEIMAGSFGGNVLAGAFTAAAAAAANFAKESVGAALSAEQALVVLRTQSRLTGTDLAANIALAKQLAKEFRISDTAGLGIVGAGTKFTSSAGKPEETLNFLRAVADLSAAAGRPLSDLQETLRQLAAGGAVQESALDKIGGGVNPSQIFEAFGKSVGVASDKLTEAQRSLAIYNFLMERAGKVQGVAAESLDTTTGRISALGAAYDNIQTKLGKAIVDTEIFQKGLQGLESAATALDKPETLAGFQKMSDFLKTIARGFVIVSSSAIAFGDIMGTIWSVALTKAERFFERIYLGIQKLGNDAILGIIASVDALPAPLKAFVGLGDVNTRPAKEAAILSNTQIDARTKGLAGLNAALDVQSLGRIQEALSAANKAIADFDSPLGGATGAAPGGAAAAGAAPGSNLAASLLAGAVAGAQAGVNFRLVPVGIADGDSLTTGSRLERIAQKQEATSNRLVEGLDSLTSVIDTAQKNPPFARLIVEAGPDTLIKSAVPLGGAAIP